MKASAGRRPLALKILQQLVIQPQNPAAVERALQRLRISLAGDVFEKLVDSAAPLEHRVVIFPGTNQMRQGKLLGGKIQLNRMAERDFERIVFTPRPAL